MKNVINKIKKTKKSTVILVVTCLVILATIGFSYAYFQLGLHAEQITTIHVDVGQLENFTYSSGDTITINETTLTGSTNPTATLIPGTEEILIQSTYDVYFQTVNNTFFYTTEAKDAELILTITDPAGNVVTEADGLSYITTASGVSGFDITEFWGFAPISLDYPISSQDMTNGTTQTWTATVTFVDLPGEQILPEGVSRSFEGVMLLKNGEIKGLNEQIIEAGGGIEYIESKPSPTYASGEYIYTGLYSALDDYGTTYYFRGSGVDNNFVEFSGHLWEIIRINGDGSVRMLYAEDAAIGSSLYNNNNYNGRWEYLGYTYTPNLSTGSEVNSVIKNIVDNWYSINLVQNKNYIVDSIYCNSKITSTNTNGYVGNPLSLDQTIYYQSSSRISSNKPVYNCQFKNDSYTVEDSDIGNGWLKYPIALISADEIKYSSSLFNMSLFHTMTPVGFHYNSRDGGLSYYSTYGSNLSLISHNSTAEVRPVISIKGSSLVTGTGTKTNPYNVIGDDETPGV